MWSIMTSHGALLKGYLNGDEDDGNLVEEQCDKCELFQLDKRW